jgi:hypothetical protein
VLLQRSSERFFAEPEDRALAEVGDFQGVGGKHEQKQKRQGMNYSAAEQISTPTSIETS